MQIFCLGNVSKCHVSTHFLSRYGTVWYQVCITLSTSSGHMTFHDIYGHFLNDKEQTALVHYKYS